MLDLCRPNIVTMVQDAEQLKIQKGFREMACKKTDLLVVEVGQLGLQLLVKSGVPRDVPGAARTRSKVLHRLHK